MGTSNKFLLFHQGALGDFILALPVFESLNDKYPGAHFTLIASPANGSLISFRPYIRRVVPKDLALLAPLFLEVPTRMEKIASVLGAPFDKAFLFGQSQLSIVARNVSALCRGKVYKVHSFPPNGQKVKVTEFLYGQLGKQGLELSSSKAVIAPDPKRKQQGVEFAQELLKRFDAIIAIHPGSGSPKKIWPLRYWKKVLEYLGKHVKAVKVILSGPADEEVVSNLIGENCPDDFMVIRNWPLPALAGLLERSLLYLGNDSGLTHLATVLSIPTIAIFGSSDPDVWGPAGKHVRIIKTRWSYPDNLKLSEEHLMIEVPKDFIKVISYLQDFAKGMKICCSKSLHR